MREYYRAITADNLGLIERYEKELNDLAASETRNTDLLRSAEKQNNDLKEVSSPRLPCGDNKLTA